MHWDLGNLAGTLGVMIPIVAIVGGLATGVVAIVTDYRRRREIYEMHHKERMLALERGVELPPLPPGLVDDDEATIRASAQAFKDIAGSRAVRRYRSSLRSGLSWLFIGLGLGVALYLNQGPESASWALIPIGLGLARLIYHFSGERFAPPPDGR